MSTVEDTELLDYEDEEELAAEAEQQPAEDMDTSDGKRKSTLRLSSLVSSITLHNQMRLLCLVH